MLDCFGRCSSGRSRTLEIRNLNVISIRRSCPCLALTDFYCCDARLTSFFGDRGYNIYLKGLAVILIDLTFTIVSEIKDKIKSYTSLQN